MKIACLTVVYPSMKNHFNDYIESLNAQTGVEFDIIMINDNFGNDINFYCNRINNEVKLFKHEGSPQANRIFGLEVCKRLGYDLIICTDSDETMYHNRIELVFKYFSNNHHEDIVFNNGDCTYNERYFSLFYKEQLNLFDILDFNVLGYGALNLRSKTIPFVTGIANENVLVFDWWLALTYLLNNPSITFLKEAKTKLKYHEGNFIGPIFEVNRKRIEFGITIKKNIYSELILYCEKNNLIDKILIFREKIYEIEEIETFIEQNTFETYFHLVNKYFHNKNIYWWFEILPINYLKKENILCD